MKGRTRFERAVREHATKKARDEGENVQLGQVQSGGKIALLESRHVITDDEYSYSQWVRHYDDIDGVDAGDTVTLLRRRTGGEIHWIVTDVVADKTPNPLRGAAS